MARYVIVISLLLLSVLSLLLSLASDACASDCEGVGQREEEGERKAFACLDEQKARRTGGEDG